jgi:hypothetical protein
MRRISCLFLDERGLKPLLRGTLLKLLFKRKGTAMKKSAILFVIVLSFAGMLTIPAHASDILYDNSTTSSYEGNGYYVGEGSSITNSFSLSSNSTITGIALGIDLMPMDPVSEVDWQITTSPFDGTVIDSGTATTFDETDFISPDNGFMYPAQIIFGIDNPDLLAGNYWLEVDNIVGTLNGYPVSVLWDTSYGPSTAYTSYSDGGQNSETFQILGTEDASTPEPSTFFLLGSGLAGLAGLIKRKLAA